MALKMTVFGIANLANAAKINFTSCDLCLRNPNAIVLEVSYKNVDRRLASNVCLARY